MKRSTLIALMLCTVSVLAQAENTADAAGITWKPIGLSGGGGMFSPAISPADRNLMMLNCDMGAAYLSEDGGHHWRMIHHAQLRSDTRCRPAFHPTNPNIIFASSRGQLRVSHDRGETFSPIGNLTERLYGEIRINPTAPQMMLVGLSQGGCRRSMDGGKTWTKCNGPTGQVIAFHFDQTRPRLGMYAASEKGIWRSDDAGATWTPIVQGLSNRDIQGFTAGSNADDELIALYCTVTSQKVEQRLSGGVFRSMDRGKSWQSAMGAGINQETSKADRWAYGDIAQYKQILTTDKQPLTVYVCNSSTGFRPPHHETVYRSDNGGREWRATFFEDPRFQRYNITRNYVTASTGQSWKGGSTPFGITICNSDPDRLLLVRSHAFATHNGGNDWFCADTYPAVDRLPKPGSAWACNGLVVTTTWHYYVDPFQPMRHYIAYTDLGFSRSLDGGESWIWWDPKSWAPWRNTCYEIAFDPELPGKMWGAFSNVHDIPNDNIISERHGHDRPGGICSSSDFGATWKSTANGIPPKPVTSIVLDPSSPKGKRTLYAGVFMEGVYRSTDDGETWTLKRNGLGRTVNRRVYRVHLHPDGTLFAIICAKRPGPGKPLLHDGVGIYRSRDQGENWEFLNASHRFLYPKDFSVHPNDSNRILVGTCDTSWDHKTGGLYETSNAGKDWRRIGRQGRQTFGGYYHPKHTDWIYMTLTEGAPEAGLWLSRDNGNSWQPFNDLPFSNIQRVVFDRENENAIYVTTFGGSVWHGPATPE